MKNKYTDTYWNHGDRPIFISHAVKPDPFGGPGTMENKIIVFPGDGINLNVLNLKRAKPKKLALTNLK